jgi:hypothetical protein
MKIWAECAGVDSILARQEVFIIRSDSDQSQIEDFGLTLEEGKESRGRRKPNIPRLKSSKAALLIGL